MANKTINKLMIFMLVMFIFIVSIGGMILIWQNKKSGISKNHKESVMQNHPIKELKPYNGNDIVSHDTPISKEVLQPFKGKEGGRLNSSICTEEPTYIGVALSEEELRTFFEENEREMIENYHFLSHTQKTVEISKNGFSALSLEKERHNIIVADVLAFPIKEVDTGRWVGTIDIYKDEDGIHYQVSGDALAERVQEKLKQNYSGELVAVCKYYNFYVIITSDQQVYGLDSRERKRLFSKLPFDDYYSFFLTNYNKANFDFS